MCQFLCNKSMEELIDILQNDSSSRVVVTREILLRRPSSHSLTSGQVIDLFIYCDPAQRPRFFSLVEEMSSAFTPMELETIGKAAPEFRKKIITILDRHYQGSRARESVLVALNVA